MATEDVDYYDLLGIEQDATLQQINKAFRQKSLKVHPDRNPDNPEAASLFHQLRVAADVLIDPTQRASFDALLNARNARKKRFEALDNKRKAQAEDLDRREREYKRQRGEQAQEESKKQYELNRLKEQGRKLREEREKALAEAQSAARQSVEDETSRKPVSPRDEPGIALDPLDTTIRIKWVKQDQPALTTIEALQAYVAALVAPHPANIDSVVLSAKFVANPTKGKNASAVINFNTLTAAKRVIDVLSGPSRIEGKSTKGVEANWASGSEPAVLSRAKEASGSTRPVPSDAPAPSETASSGKPLPKSMLVDSKEDQILAMLRAKERAKLEQAIIDAERDA